MIDKEKVKQAVTLLLEGIGEDCSREGLRGTPDRMARMYEEIFAGMGQTPAEALSKTFEVADSGIVMERILFSIQSASIICCHFMERHMWHTYRTARWRG